MFKLLRKLLGRNLAAQAEPAPEIDENLSDAQILREYFSVPKQVKAALKHFITLISEDLGEQESRRLTRVVLSNLQPGDTANEAITNGMLGEKGQRRGKWFLIQLDWKATEDLEWQANEVLMTAGIAESWQLQSASGKSVPMALLEFSSWVRHRGFQLLHLDLGHDAYYAFLVNDTKVEEVLRAAKEAALKVQDSSEFGRENAA